MEKELFEPTHFIEVFKIMGSVHQSKCLMPINALDEVLKVNGKVIQTIALFKIKAK